MTDDEILDALDRRLADVEARLPPTAVRPAGAIVVGPTRAGRVLPSNPLPSVIVVGVLVAAVAFGSRLSGGVAGVAGTSAEAPPTGTSFVTASIEPSTGPTSAALEVIRGPGDGDQLLTSRFGWGPCMAGMDVFIAPPDGKAVDAVMDRDGIVDGWVGLGGDRRVWVSATAEAAAAAHGATVLALGGRGDRWVAIDGKGRQLDSFETPKGRTMWVLTGSVGNAPCGPGEAPSPSPSASAAPLQIIRARPGVDAMTGLIEHLKLGPCFMGSEPLTLRPDGDAIDRAIDEGGVIPGFVDVEFSIGGPSRLANVWIGSTAESAARGYGSTILGLGAGNPWIYVDGLGSQLDKIETPKGRFAWFLGATTRPTAC